MTITSDPLAPNTGPATTNPLPPPPVQAEHAGAPSTTTTQGGAVSEQLLPSGTTGAQEEAQSAATMAETQGSVGQTPTQASGAGASAQNAATATSGVNSALAQTISMAIALGLAQTPTTAAGWTQLADTYATSAGQNAVTVAEQAAPTAPSAAPAGPSQPGSSAPFAGGGSEAQWAATVLANAGLPQTQNNVDNMMRWMTAEEPTSNWSDRNNPLNASLGTSASDGTGSYTDLGQAAQYTAQMIMQGNMAGIHAALSANADPAAFSAAVVASPWASSHYGGDPNHIADIPAPGGSFTSVSPVAESAPHTQAAFTSTNTVVGLAQSQLGVPYAWGGESQGQDFDCSGLVQWAYGKEGVQLPRVAQDQYNATAKIAGGVQNYQPGDLLFFGTGPNGVEHVGIYIGNGQMIDAPHTGADVRVDQVFGPQGQPLWAGFVGATRPGDPSGQTTPAAGSPAQQGLQQNAGQYGQILQNVTAQLAQLQGMYPGIFDTTQAVMP